jgi:hypothetical protein
MDKSLIERLSKEAGLAYEYDGKLIARTDLEGGADISDELQKFASLVAEECAKLCEARECHETDWDTSDWNQAVSGCAYDIRSKFRSTP